MWFVRRPSGFAPVVFALAIAALFSRGIPWLGERQWALDMAVGTTALTGPATAMAAAWFAIGDGHLAQVVGLARRRLGLPIASIATAWLLGVLGLLLALAVVTALTLSGINGGPLNPLPILSALAVLLFCSALGYRIGAVLPRLISLAIAPVCVFTLGVIPVLTPLPDWFRPGLHTGSLAGLTPALRVIASGVFGLACLTLALVPVAEGARSWARRTTRAVALLGVVVAAAISRDIGDEPYRPVPVAVDACASSVGIEFCAVPEHRAALNVLVVETGPMIAALRKAGVALDGRLVERVAGQHPGPGVGSFHLERIRTVSTSEAVRALLNPGACPEFRSLRPVAQHSRDAMADLAAWIAVEVGESPGLLDGREHKRLLSMPAALQQQWVRQTYASLQACDLERMFPAGSPP
jgi:hypothetical protein